MRNKISLGNEIKSAVIQQGDILAHVARVVGISRSYMTDITKDRRTPSDNVLESLIMFLNLNRNYAYYLVNRYPPEIRNKEINLHVLNQALEWVMKPMDYTLRKTK